MKTLKTIVVSSGMFLITVAALVLINPIPSLAVTCWSNCADGTRVHCTGDSCDVTAGGGVVCTRNGISFGVDCDKAEIEPIGIDPIETLN